MRILVSGCCGFIGSHLTETLLSQGKDIDVMGVDNINDYYEPRVKHENLDGLRKHSRFSFLQEDMVTSRCIATWKPDVVYHLGLFLPSAAGPATRDGINARRRASHGD